MAASKMIKMSRYICVRQRTDILASGQYIQLHFFARLVKMTQEKGYYSSIGFELQKTYVAQKLLPQT
jgi:hypothetical protein